MGCPDAVRAELLKVKGVLVVSYHNDRDIFSVRYESVLIGLETICATVRNAPKSAYLLLEDQPAMIMPRVLIAPMATI